MVHYGGVINQEFQGGVRLSARWERAALDLGYARFERGDRFIEWFYQDRWYNIFEIHAGATGAIKGWYCNIATPATITVDEITSRDLLLDLWVEPTGGMLVLDEDEFEADSNMDEGTRRAARAALAALQARVNCRQAPFDAITS